MRFNELPLSEPVLRALEAMGFEETTPVQEATIPLLLEGKDVIGQAQTGTGKTAAFGIPIIESATRGGRAIILTPTRELAKQVQRELQAIGKGSPVDVLCLIGGAHFGEQVQALKRHPKASIVATPGRVVDHLGRGTLKLDDITMLVLDEADEMLSMGFQDEVDAIVAALPAKRQGMLFSATVAKPIERLAQKALNDAVILRIGMQGAKKSIEQSYLEIPGRERVAAIKAILEAEQPKATLMFGKTRIRVQELADALRSLGAEALHGGMAQNQRDAVMKRLRAGTTKLLVATDVAARGLDVDDIDLVLHDDMPSDADTYVHRVGRTGRIGREGRSILFVTPGKARRLKSLRPVVGDLSQYKLPGAKELAQMRAHRLLDTIMEMEPGMEGEQVLEAARAAGMDLQDIAVRAFQHMLTEPEATEPVVEVSATGGLALKVGHYDSVRPGSLVAMLVNMGGVRADEIGRIDILDKMSVVEIPTREMDRVCQALERSTISGRRVMPRPAEDWRFKNSPRR